MTVQPLTPEQLATLNPGIRHTVQALREWGFDTCDSGDGQTREFECDLPYPFVHIRIEPADMIMETDRLVALLLVHHNITFDNQPDPQESPEAADSWRSIEAVYVPSQSRSAFITICNVIIPDHV